MLCCKCFFSNGASKCVFIGIPVILIVGFMLTIDIIQFQIKKKKHTTGLLRIHMQQEENQTK